MTKVARILVPLIVALLAVPGASIALASPAAFTTDKTGARVNQNIYQTSTDVYVNGGPQNAGSAGFPDGSYYFQVTDPSGAYLLSTDGAACRQVQVAHGVVTGAIGPCPHALGVYNPANGSTSVQLYPFSASQDAGNMYKVWLIPENSSTSVSATDPRVLSFSQASTRTDNFKVLTPTPVPTGSCQPSSSLSVLVNGKNVTAYVPKGSWVDPGITPATGISVVNVEGASIIPTFISTPEVVNSAASNPFTGQTVAVANDGDVYLLNGTTITNTLTSGASGQIGFSGGSCTNCGVAMDALHNKAVISMSVGGRPGFQVLNLNSSPIFESPFASPAGHVSEDALIDPLRNLLLSPSEFNNYELVNLETSMSPSFYENQVADPSGDLDSAGEDCSTGIALAPAEFAGPSQVYIADLSQAEFTPGSPGSWTAPSQMQTLSESDLSAGASGVAVAQGTHLGVVTGEFGGDALTAIALPSSSGIGTPAITDWVTCSISGFSNGFDPHTVTAYQSPNSGDATALLANASATSLESIDLAKMLNTSVVPRTPGGHGCASGALPPSVVSSISVP